MIANWWCHLSYNHEAIIEWGGRYVNVEIKVDVRVPFPLTFPVTVFPTPNARSRRAHQYGKDTDPPSMSAANGQINTQLTSSKLKNLLTVA